MEELVAALLRFVGALSIVSTVVCCSAYQSNSHSAPDIRAGRIDKMLLLTALCFLAATGAKVVQRRERAVKRGMGRNPHRRRLIRRARIVGKR